MISRRQARTDYEMDPFAKNEIKAMCWISNSAWSTKTNYLFLECGSFG